MMSESPSPSFQRDYAAVFAARLGEPRRFLHVVSGPRQVGKTTLVQQVLEEIGRPHVFVSADEPALRDTAWLAAQWERARLLAKDAGKDGAVLALDEAQKISGWSEAVKRLWARTACGPYGRAFKPKRTLLVGGDGIPVDEFLARPVTDWLQP